MLTAQQLEARKRGIGGSDVAAIAGCSRWRAPLDVYLEKLDLADTDKKNAHDAMYFGQLLEPIIAQEYERRTGHRCSIESQTLQHPQYPWMLAHIDRWIEVPEEQNEQNKKEKRVLECKTANAFAKDEWGEPGTDQIPNEYLLQCAHYAIVCDVREVHLAVLIGGQIFRIYIYSRHQELEQKLIEMEHTFWHEHVLKKIPPDPKTPEQAFALWPQEKQESVVVAQEDILEQLYSLKDIKEKINTLKKEESELQAHINHFMKEASRLMDVGGNVLATWKNQTTNRFDTTAFKNTHPDLYQQFTHPSSSRVFRLNHKGV